MLKSPIKLLRAPQYQPGLDVAEYHAHVVCHFLFMCGFLLHLLFLFVFQALGVHLLAAYNIISCAAFALALRWLKTRTLYHAISIVSVEVFVHALLAVIFIGEATGFHIYLLSLMAFMPILPKPARKWRLTIAALLAASFVLLVILALDREPWYPVSGETLLVLNIGNTVSGFVLMCLVIYYLSHAAQKAQHYVETQARTDFLTGLLNRRGTLEQLERTLADSKRHERTFTVIIGDLDDFKGMNDRCGHDVGDRVLAEVATALSQVLRGCDTVGRWGGEEFLILLPETGSGAAAVVADRLLEAVRSIEKPASLGNHALTISLGSATWNGEPINRLITNADMALYQAKYDGKDCSRAFS